MAIQSPDQLFSILEKSNLLDAEQILAARQSVQGFDDAAVAARKLARDGILTRWQAAQLLAGRSSFLLGKYKLIDLLGRGGMGRVFLGRHVTMQRPAALKIVSREVGSNPAALERFLAEARAIAALDHPAIVQAYSVDCEGDRYYIVMEYVDGRDLQRVVEEDGPLDWRTAVEYIRQAADGLAHAHGRNLIHCDIKPSNLLVNRQGQVKILDMGMARLGGRNDEEGGQNGNHILGSVDYLAPEQALGSETFDHRADIYSLGCTLYFLLTGHAPFPEGTLPQRILKHQTQEPAPIPAERSDVPSPLVQVCGCMMAKQPEDRYQSADEVIAALAEVPAEGGEPAASEHWVETGPVLAVHAAGPLATGRGGTERPDVFAPLRQWLSTTSGRLALGGAAMLLLTLAAGLSVGIVAITRSPRPAELPGKIATADSSKPGPPGEPAEPAEAEEAKDAEEEKDEFDLERAWLRAGGEEAAPEPPADAAPEPPADTDDGVPDEAAAAPEEPGKPEPAPDPTGPPDDAEREEPAAPKPDQPSPKEKPKPPEEAPPKDPLRDVGSSIALTGGAKPGAVTSLGRVHLPQGAALRLELLGGQTALRGNRQYLIEREQPEAEASPWLLRFQSELPGSPKTVIDLARLGVAEEDELRVEWLPEATAESIQPLRNCVLAVRVGEDTASVRLGEPEPAEPLVLDFGRRIWRATMTSDALPETGALRIEVTRIEVTRIEGNAPKLDLKPGNTVGEGDTMEVRIARPEAALMRLDVSFTVHGRALRVEAQPMFTVPGAKQWRPLSAREVQRVGTQALKQQAGLEAMLKAMPEKVPDRAKVVEQKARVDKAVAQLTRLSDVCKELNEQARIHYRVFTMAGDRQVILWTTDAAPGEASGADRVLPAADRAAAPSSATPLRLTQLVREGS